MAVHQALPSLGFPRQEHWSGLPFPSPMHESEKWKWSRSVLSDSSWPHGLQPTRLLHPWDFPGKSTGVGCHCLLWIAALLSLNCSSLVSLFPSFPDQQFYESTLWNLGRSRWLKPFFYKKEKGDMEMLWRFCIRRSTQGPAEFQVAGGHVILCVCWKIGPP